MSALDRHIRGALLSGDFDFTDPIAHRFLRIGKLELCKDFRNRWYLPTGLPNGVQLSWLTGLHLDLVRVAYMKRTPAERGNGRDEE